MILSVRFKCKYIHRSCFLTVVVSYSETCALAGMSEKAVADYCISIAKKTPDAAKLSHLFHGQGFPSSSKTEGFCKELLLRLSSADTPSSTKGDSSHKAKERAAARLARQNKEYGLLMDDDDSNLEELFNMQQKTKQSAAERKSKGERRKLRRKRSLEDEEHGDEDKEDDEVGETEQGDKEMEAEEARRRDLEEKEEFEKRLKEKDDRMTRKLAEKKISKEEMREIERRKRAEESEDRLKMVQELRKVSRQEYLKKREEAKLEELEEELEDEKYLF